MNLRTIHKIGFFLLVIFLFNACAKYNAGFLKQGYHDLTSHYNAYFNAKENYKNTIKSIETSRKDNFDELLPLYAYGTAEDTKAKASAFDITIDKSTRAIQLHQISNWSDDNFLLLGKAFYMQGEYGKAVESLRYITANHTKGVDGRSKKKIKKQKRSKKRKKRAKKQLKKQVAKQKAGKDIRPKKNLLVHEPAKSEALIWLVKTFTAQEKYTEAEAVLDYISTDKTFIQNLDKEKELAYAQLMLKQNQYSVAIEHLENATNLYKSKRKKARMYYVLAQLHQKTKQNTKAIDYFKKATKHNADYEMIFNAQLNLLKLSNKSENSKEDKLLAKMLRDSKNENYFDQLYYERALIAYQQKDIKKAKEFLNQSIEVSKDNIKQKAKSLELLADIFYAENQFVPAQENYSACLDLIDEKYPNYKTTYKRANILSVLVENLNTINKNDSLLEIAKMPKAQLENAIYAQAVEIVEQEEEAQANQNALIDKFAANDRKRNDRKWYFYSENAKSIGYAKFKELWGNRKLEDNWRRSNKNSLENTDFVQKTPEEIREDKINTLYEQLLAEVPQTEAQKESYQKALIAAHYSSANIYKHELNDEAKAAKHFRFLSDKLAPNDYEAESLYNLYLIQKEVNKGKATQHKNKILTHHSESIYAKMLKDPNYAKTMKNSNKAVEQYYQETYVSYTKEEYGNVIQRIKTAKTRFPNNKYEAKFALLEAITLGKQKKYQPYVDGLEKVKIQYAGTEEGDKATELLAFLKGETPKVDAQSITIDKNAPQNTIKENNAIFDANRDKDKEGFKVQFGKKDIIKVGINEDEDKKSKKTE